MPLEIHLIQSEVKNKANDRDLIYILRPTIKNGYTKKSKHMEEISTRSTILSRDRIKSHFYLNWLTWSIPRLRLRTRHNKMMRISGMSSTSSICRQVMQSTNLMPNLIKNGQV